MLKEFRLTEYSLHEDVKSTQHAFKHNLDSFTAQKIASRVWKSLNTNLFGKGEQVHFKGRNNPLNSLEGKSNGTGIRYDIGLGDCGIDIGTQTIDYTCESDVKLYELAPHVQNIENEKRRIQRYMDRSKKKTNPNNLDENCTIKKRAKNTTTNDKTGRINKKKRVGKSLANKAPSKFLTMLENKLKSKGGKYFEINTWRVKASQYNHLNQ